MSVQRTALRLMACVGAALLLAACGGGDDGDGGGGDGPPSIGDARACLEKASLTVEGPQGADAERLEEGVLGTSGLNGEGLTIAVSAVVKDEKYVEEFTRNVESFKDELTAEEQRRLTVRSGSDDAYVWVVAGDTSTKTFGAAESCVKP